MARLRGPNGCPWDKEQTPESLIPCLLEETHEVIAAIDSKDSAHLKEELGDLLLQVVFHAQIGAERNSFEMRDVLLHLINKLVRRHPHVFGGEELERPEEALKQWEQIKAAEKDPGQSLLHGVPVQLPALARAYRLGSKASRVGFDWPNLEGVLKKVEEELQELRQARENESEDTIEEEFGDLLFSLAQAARFLRLNPEEALRKSGLKFQKRFEWMETALAGQNRRLLDCKLEELESLWAQAKSSTDSVKKL